MPKHYVTILGKTIQKIARLRGGGSALPGLFVERVDPEFVPKTLEKLPKGVVVVSGTNGKTTTTKMVVELLEGQGLKVFTNRTGSNFIRGVAAALLSEVDSKGNLNADIAVLELDEAHAVHFVKKIQPRFSLLLNVMRDQLDRFGEIDTTAKMLAVVAQNTTQGIVLNREDPRVAKIGSLINSRQVVYFGLDPDLASRFPNDDELRTGKKAEASVHTADVILKAIDGELATFLIGKKEYSAELKLDGIYNIFNAAAALALVNTILGDACDIDKLLATLSEVTPAFGRGEKLTIGGKTLELVLVKNPAGFRLSLASFPPEGYATMIAINDLYADGRDMSWLWDVDFESLKHGGVAEVSGKRAYDMAVRLQYDEVEIAHIHTNTSESLRHFVANYPDKPKRIYCTYTAMLALRRELASMTKVETIV